MHRCLQLARLGAGNVAPNPMVGAVLVYQDQIIGEGYHEKYGQAHAEPNCLASVKSQNRQFIPDATLYVSLEPCVHFGKTPPCTDLIIANKIRKVVVGWRDPFKEVKGKGIERLKAAGVEVVEGVLENDCREINKRFLIFHEKHRPYIILKWAQSANHKIGMAGERLYITNELTNRLVHKWRSEEASILVGTTTAMVDNPGLTTRLWKGNNPVRLVIDRNLSLPTTLRLFDGTSKTIVFNTVKNEEQDKITFYRVTNDVSMVHQVLNALHALKIQSLIVEGGARLIQSFIDEDLWDEARVISNDDLEIPRGLNAPVLENAKKVSEEKILNDRIEFFQRIDS